MTWSLPSKKFVITSCDPGVANAGSTVKLRLTGKNKTGRHGSHLDWRVYLWPKNTAVKAGEDPAKLGAIAGEHVKYERVAGSDDFTLTADVKLPARGLYQLTAGWSEPHPQAGEFGALEPVDGVNDGWFEVT